MDWIFPAYDRDQWQAVNTVMNLGSNNRQGISWLAEELSASEEELCCMEIISSM